MTDNIRLSPFGRELRYWRRHRGLSQLELSATADSTSRHISFLETGRSRPSATMVDRLCETLNVPISDRNLLFEAAGFTAPYRSDTIDDPNLEPFRFAIESMLSQHMPFPAFATDRTWNIVLTNPTAEKLLGHEERNTARLLFGGPWRAMIENWPAAAWAALARLRDDASNYPDNEELAELIELARAALVGTPRPTEIGTGLVVCPRIRINDHVIPTVTVTARFGAPRTTTTDELRIELMFPETELGRDLFTQLAELGEDR